MRQHNYLTLITMSPRSSLHNLNAFLANSHKHILQQIIYLPSKILVTGSCTLHTR